MEDGLVALFERFFPGRTSEENALLERLMASRQVAAGESLFCAGQPRDALYLVAQGAFAVHRHLGLEERSLVVALLSQGAAIGEGVIGGPKPHCSTVVAMEPSTVLALTGEALTELETEAPRLFIVLLKKILAMSSLRLEKNTDRLVLVL
ncbi:MAG: Crp/Fnr family transcriptional regulator [Desulfopila sp.]